MFVIGKLGVFGEPWVKPLFLALASIIIWLWGLTLLGVWFHPQRGTARSSRPWFISVSQRFQVFFRWYASVFLTLWFLVPVLIAILSLARVAA